MGYDGGILDSPLDKENRWTWKAGSEVKSRVYNIKSIHVKKMKMKNIKEP